MQRSSLHYKQPSLLGVHPRHSARVYGRPAASAAALHQLIRVSEAIAKLGRDEDALSSARRGIAETRGADRQALALARDVHEHREALMQAFALHRERMASSQHLPRVRDLNPRRPGTS